jgi:PAS domain S-box-containing protein
MTRLAGPRPRVWPFAAFCLLAFAAPAFAAGQENAPPARPKTVLVLHSYGPDLGRTRGVQAGIEAALSQAAFPVALRVEYLDAQAPRAKRYFDLQEALLAEKYAPSPPDLIIVSADAALAFILDRRANFLPGTPVVFCAVNGFEDAMLRGERGITGVSQVPSFRDTIAAIRKLFPGARRVFVAGDGDQAAVRKAAEGFADLEFVYSRERDADALCALAAGFTRETAVLLASGLRDGAGRSLSLGQSADRLSRAAPVPVFSCWDCVLGHGVLGGKLISSGDQGAAAGAMAVEALSGENVERIPIRYESPNRFVFDAAAMERFGVDAAALPGGSRIVGHKTDFAAGHPAWFWGAGGLFAAMLAALAAMAASVARRRRAEARAAAGEKRLRLIADSLPALIGHVGADERYLFVNQRYQDWYGVGLDQIVGRSVREVIGETAYVPAQDMIRRALAGELVSSERDLALPDGRVLSLHFHFIPGRDEHGRVESYYVLADDITSLKRMREELRETRNYLSNIIDSMPSVLAGVDSGGRVTHFNAEAARVSGLSREQALGRELGDIFALPADLRDIIRGCIRDKKAYKREKLPLRLGDGGRWADLSVYPLIESDCLGAVVRLDDVTRRAIMEEVMVHSEKMISVGGLAAGVAHEINNPLSGIVQAAQVIARRLDPGLAGNVKAAEACGVDLRAMRAYLEQRGVLRNVLGIRELCERAAKIVSGMLAFSRKSASRSQPASAGDMVATVLELAVHDYDLRKRCDFRRIKIVSDIDPGLPPIPCVRTEIEQVLFNLLKNAAQALAEPGAERDRPRIVISARAAGDMAVIEVADNGPGMPEEVRGQVFEPFYTTKDAGTGLGLSVSYFIVVENHKGCFLVESEPGKGSKFSIELPLRAKQ